MKNTDFKASKTAISVSCSLILSFLMSASASAQAQLKGKVTNEGGVRIVHNPKEPIFRTPVLELTEELSIGGPEAQGQAVFKRMGEFVNDDAGNFYISDGRGEDCVKVFDKAGRYVKTIGRHGQGPGEFDGIGPLSFVSATGELAVANIRLRCLTFFRTSGRYLRDLRLEEPKYVSARLDSQGRIYAFAGGFEIGKPYFEVRIATLDREGKPTRILARGPGQVKDKIGMFKPGMLWGLGETDNLIVGFNEFYELQIFDAATQRLSMKIRKDFDTVPVGEEELARYDLPRMKEMGFDFAKEHAAFRNFFTSDTGYLFVATFEKAPDGQFIHDVFDKEGRLVARMPFKPIGVKIVGDKYYALEEDEDGYQYVKRYAVTWKVK